MLHAFHSHRLSRAPARATRRRQLEHVSASLGTAGTTTSIAPNCSATRAIAEPNTGAIRRISLVRLPGKTKSSGGSASRRRFSRSFGRKFAEALGQRMTNVTARRTIKFSHGLRLERQQRQYVVHVRAHGARATRPPRPHRRADVINNGNSWRPRAHPPRHAMSELRAIYNNQRIGFRRYNRIRSFANTAENLWQVAPELQQSR